MSLFRHVGRYFETPQLLIQMQAGSVLGWHKGRRPEWSNGLSTCSGPPTAYLFIINLQRLEPIEFPLYSSGSWKAQALQAKVNTMLLKGAAEIFSNKTQAFYSRLFLLEKASGRLRTVIDLSIWCELQEPLSTNPGEYIR